jgi:predicted ATPase
LLFLDSMRTIEMYEIGGSFKRLEKIEIEGLFHKFHHVIPLKMDDRITIIYGLNGYGKTTILKLLNDFLSYNFTDYTDDSFFEDCFAEIKNIPYHIIRLTFEDSSKINIYKNYFFLMSQALKDEYYDTFLIKDDIYKDKRLFFELILPKLNRERMIFSFDGESFEFYKQKKRRMNYEKKLLVKEEIKKDIQNLDFLFKIGEDDDSKIEKPEEVRDLKKLKDVEKNRKMIRNEIKSLELQLDQLTEKLREKKSLKKSLNNTNDPQILHYDNNVINNNDEIVSLEMKFKTLIKKLEMLKIDYAQLNDIRNQIVHKSPKKIIKILQFGDKNEKTLKTLFISTSRLKGDLLSLTIEDLPNLTRHYKDDVKFAKKTQLLTKIIETFLQNKSVRHDKNEGLVIFDKTTKIKILPEHLSSGEEQIIVIFLNLIFRTTPSCLVLIDEPEISLHVSWQRKFIEIIEEIIQIIDFDVIISTHSPSIVHDRMDLTVPLIGDVE